MQRLGGERERERNGECEVVLNAYERLGREVGVAGVVGRWFEDDEMVLKGLGWDVEGMKKWWVERGKGRGRGRGRDGER